MAVGRRGRPAGWILDKSAVARTSRPEARQQLEMIEEPVMVCPVSRLEQLYSAQSATDYDRIMNGLTSRFPFVDPPPTVFDDVLALQRDLAHHHGLWHRMALPDLFIAVTALAHGYGVLHHDRDYERISEIRPLITRRIG